MELIVVGASGTFPRAGGACNGFLLRHGATNILLDMGAAVLSRLFRWTPPAKIDALVLTHLHPDHFVDIYPFRYLLEFTAKERLPLKVLAPTGATAHIQPLFNESDPRKFDQVFDFVDMNDGRSWSIKDINLTARAVPHLEPTFGIAAEAGGKRVFYTADTAFDDRLVDYAANVDLLLAETTLPADQQGAPVAHMSTTEVGRLAQRAKVKRLLLVHLWPHLDRDRIKAEVADEFDGKIDLADEDLLIEV